MHLFGEAQQQLRAAMSGGDGLLPGARVVQVGDLGGYKHGPGAAAAPRPSEPKHCHCTRRPLQARPRLHGRTEESEERSRAEGSRAEQSSLED